MAEHHSPQEPNEQESPEPTGQFQTPEGPSELSRVIEQYLDDLQAGRKPDRAQILADHPAIAAQLEACLASLDAVPDAARPVEASFVQLGDFRLLREIGRGGMGVVYEAEQLSLKRKVAVKVLCFGATTEPSAMQRFQREAEMIAGLHHTNIVPVFAVGCEQGVWYFAMQLITGRSLAAVLEQARRKDTPLWPRDVARWGVQAAEALAHAHQRGIIHRDVKPSNLILDANDTVWLMDFGLAQRFDEARLTRTGALLGTPSYMSPEQASPARQPLDERTDVYSLGAALYELATGHPVFDGATPQAVIAQILSAEPVAPRTRRPAVPRDLETILLKCLQKEPRRRYATAQKLADDLRAFLERRPIKARPPGWTERAMRWAGKRWQTMPFVLGVALVALLLAGAVFGWNAFQQAQSGRMTFATEGPPLVAEMCHADREERVIPSFTIPTQQPLALPAGMYRLLVSAPGRLSATYQILVEKGEHRTVAVAGNDQQLWELFKGELNRGIEPEIDVQLLAFIDQDGKSRADLVVTDNRRFSSPHYGLRRIDGRTGKTLWHHRPVRTLPVFGANTVGLLGSPLGQGPLLAVSGLTGYPESQNFRKFY